MSGRIPATNAALLDDPALINRNPEGDDWLYRMPPNDTASLDSLIDQAAYNALIDAL